MARRNNGPRTTYQGPRSAISLTEVLIAMGIMTVGLLGVASVFPVGSWYLQKADIADQGSAIAQSVMSDLVARGMLNPGAWYLMTPAPLNATSTHPNCRFMSIDGKYSPNRAPVPGTFTRPFAETLREGLKQNIDPKILAKQFGHAFVIDPMFAAAATNNNGNGNWNVPAYCFPAAAHAAFPWNSSAYYGTAAWNPWRATGGAASVERVWPIRRVSFQSTYASPGGPQSSGWPLDLTEAESLCRGTDDLAYDFPQRPDRPSIQTWDTVTAAASTAPLARKWTGDYSWIATVVPTTNAARDGMARNPEGFAYDVSVVVFHKRAMPAWPPTAATMVDAAMNERAVSAKILSTGLNGGELLLEQILRNNNSIDNINESPFAGLKQGQWIMLCGPHPNSSDSEPRFVLQWYQVISIDTEGNGIAGFDPTKHRVVSVRGPQWPWQPAGNLSYSALSNDLCVAICRGAVAVHSKTIRLESPLGGSYGTGRSVITPPGVGDGNTWQ